MQQLFIPYAHLFLQNVTIQFISRRELPAGSKNTFYNSQSSIVLVRYYSEEENLKITLSLAFPKFSLKH